MTRRIPGFVPIRRAIAGLAGSLFLALAIAPAPAIAQAFPSKPITIVVPVTAGGPSDLMTRAIAQKLSAELGTSVVVENRTGAAGLIGLKHVLAQKPDGYTYVMAGSNVLAAMPHLDPNVGYDVNKDIEPITLVSKTALILFQTTQLPSTTLRELIAYGKENPGKLTFASAGSASTAHLSGEFLSLVTGVPLTHVPYRGSSAAMPDLLSGRTHIFFDASQTMSFVKDGQLRALAVNSPRRLAVYPNVPTFAEAGLPEFTIGLWFALVGPKGIPAPVVDRMNRAMRTALGDPALVETFMKQGVELQWTTPAGLWAYKDEQSAKMKQMIVTRNIKAN
ncbi:Bug family tripartite tricarboxylate transporter substrate binding protein [Ramlibacter sp.]|uniref:Bug family tripartite tricarboxylate transporter substrate binding protein n=1 Tax=Ramlibacter sp. TaxID=1917967 RepID=UPI003D122FF1